MRPGHRHQLSGDDARRSVRRRGPLPRLFPVVFLLWPLALGGCAQAPAPVAAVPAVGAGGTVALVTHGWHTDIAVPADEVSGPLAQFRTLFPGARTLVFGYGKRTFIIAPAHGIGEWILGPVPGPAAIEVSAVSADAATAYGASHVQIMALPPGGAAGLSAFLWHALAKNKAGQPVYIARGNWKGALFYEASAGYGLFHTCNSWSAEALAAGGVPVRPQGVIFSGTLDAQVRDLPAG